MKKRRIFAQLVNQWQEEAKEDFKAQKRRLWNARKRAQRAKGTTSQNEACARALAHCAPARALHPGVRCSMPRCMPRALQHAQRRCNMPKGSQFLATGPPVISSTKSLPPLVPSLDNRTVQEDRGRRVKTVSGVRKKVIAEKAKKARHFEAVKQKS
ncbi:hypothetical protein L484_021427 [Morus notabilis]|uniref:Uncharacterized protein n=1 Tax=Morus notabilis TaxID=981085 RepID=W9RPP6_9ROSA|nr:hypothetical protein L484_021427 [Morus notabilis]